MEGILKDLGKLESKSSGSSIESVQASIDALERWKSALTADAGAIYKHRTCNSELQAELRCDDLDASDDEEAAAEAAFQQLQASTSKLAETGKDWYSAMTKYGKAVDKVGLH